MNETPLILSSAAYNDRQRSEEMLRPSMMLKPRIERGVRYDTVSQFSWKATYGSVEAYGSTPEEAYLNFDKAWEGEE